jgi:class 3 adenylate cyclase
MSDVVETSPVERARAALGRHAWREAFELLSTADAAGGLSPAELELFAEAAWWVGKLPVTIEVRERAYAAAIKAQDQQTATEVAILLARDHLFRNAYPVANAWLRRAERLLEGREEDAGHGWLAAVRSFYDALVGDEEGALAEATRALEIGRRVKDRDLEAFALSEKGAALVTQGHVEEGLALVDEATVAAVSGELEPGIAGGVCCTTIETCSALGEWSRAAEWTEAQDRWCRREGINGYPGMCRVFRSEIKRRRGAWLEAEAEARQASVEMEGFVPAAVGTALYQIGEIRLRRGDLPAAEAALIQAHGLGTDPEPALSLLRLAEGKVEVAAAGIRRALDAPVKTPTWRATPDSGLHRLPLLEAQVEIALAANDASTARAAAEEIGQIAERYTTRLPKASAAAARGVVELAEGDIQAASRDLQLAVELCTLAEAPYETAVVRRALAEAFAAGGDADAAIVEARAARAGFEHLGAVPDLRRTDRLLATLEASTDPRAASPAGDRVVRTFVFTDIVDSTKLAELLGDEAWNKVMRWHDQALRAVVAEHGGEEIKATGDGFFLAFDDPDRAIESAMAIQRRLAEQRQSQGFAPSVRIGVHRAEASRSGLDYVGGGVNQAARIGAAAAGSEVLVSATTLDASRRRDLPVERRSIELRGISAPVEVAAVDWR